MKINVITLHRARNYGSLLQTLATQNILESKGYETEIIDYYPERYTSFGLLKRLKNKSPKFKKNPIFLLAARIIISFSYIKKKLVFDKFLKKYINMTPVTYRTEDDLLKNCPDGDAYCTGSDQVWNSHWNEGIDSPLYLSFVPETCYKFSYAASIGKTNLHDDEIKMIKPYFKQYNHITVREKDGVDIMSSMGIDDVLQVLDPTLLFKADIWNKYTSDRFKDKKYIVTYNLHHDKRIDDYAEKIAQKYGLKVYNISYNWHDIIRKGSLKWCPTVEEFLGLIRDAQYVVADSFHATVFSLVFEKKFMIIYPEEASSRLRSILDLLNLQCRGKDEMPEIEDIEADIEYENVNEILDRERQKVNNYLDNVLDEISKRN